MMHNTCLNSAVSLRCRVSPSSQFTDPTYFQDARFDSNPLLIVSSFSSCCSCCCCCCTANSNLIYNRLPRINPRYLCNGLRQSTLIQFSPSKRLNFHGSRRQPCNTTSGFSSLTDSDRNYYYDKLYSFKEKKKLGNRRYGIENQKKEQRFSNSDCLNDVEILLDLLTEEVGLENIGVRERKRTNKKDNKTKIVSSGSVKKNLKHDNKAVKIQCMEEEEEEEEEDRRLINKKKEEEKGSFVKKVNRERKKEGSSCSSYYSVSSTGEYESDNDVEIKHDVGESSREYKDDQRRDSYRSYNEENVKRREDFEEEKSENLKKKNTDERYYGHQEWRKESEKKLDVESSSQQQSQVSVYNDRKSQNQEKTDRIISQSQLQSGMNYKILTETDKKLSTSVQEQRETADFRRQSNVISEISGIQEMNMKKASSSSSSSSSLIKNQEHKSTEVNTSQVENRRAEKHERINQSTTLQESRVKSQQISTTSDTQITNNENNTSVSHTQSDIKSEKQELHLDTSRTEKVTMAENVDLRRKEIEDKSSSSSSRVELVTESKKTGRKTTKASSFNIGGESSSTYKALKLNPEHNIQESGARLHVGQSSQHIETIAESSRIQQSEISGVDLDIHSERIASADEEHKSSTQYLGEFVVNANNKLIASQDRHDHKTHEEQESVHEEDDNLNTSGELIKKSGRSLWNVIGDVFRLRWSSSSRSETLVAKSGGEKASSHQSGSEAWFSGHEHEDSHDEILKTASAKGRSGRRTDDNSPLLLSSSSNPNQGSSSKTMSPSVIEESSSFPVPAIRMRRSPVVKRSGSDETDASGSGNMVNTARLSPSSSSGKMVNTGQISSTSSSGKMVNTAQISPTSSSGKMVNTAQISPSSSSGNMVNTAEISPTSSGGKMVIMDEPIRKLARIDQVSRDRFDEWEEAYDIETKQRKIDEFFMKEALLEAKKGADFWEVPVGAVLVHDGKIIARGYNLVEELRDSTAHAEMICIREASNNLRSWRLSGTTLYVTLEPCPMCAGAILQARVDTVVWGAPNKLLGADGSWIRLFPDVDGGNGLDKPPAPVHPFHPNMRVRRGVLSSECADVMQQFFQLRRKKKEKKNETENEPPTPPSSCLPITHGHHQSKLLGKMHNVFHIMFCL